MMTINRFVLTSALIAAASLATTASAQERDARKREGVRSAQGGSVRGDARAERPGPARRDDAIARAEKRGDTAARSYGSRDNVVGRAEPRVEPYRGAPSVRDDRRHDEERRDYGRSYGYRGGYYAPRAYYRPYVFRPRVSIGFGIFAGYPVPFSYRFAAPIIVYGYGAPRAPVYVTPEAYGGVALEIGPSDADVFVDGNYAGHVADFDGTTEPLTLVPGTHRIEVQAPGYAPLVFDVTVQPGQVIPYRGDLRPF